MECLWHKISCVDSLSSLLSRRNNRQSSPLSSLLPPASSVNDSAAPTALSTGVLQLQGGHDTPQLRGDKYRLTTVLQSLSLVILEWWKLLELGLSPGWSSRYIEQAIMRVGLFSKKCFQGGILRCLINRSLLVARNTRSERLTVSPCVAEIAVTAFLLLDL